MDKKMKIAMFSESYKPYLNGPVKVISLLKEELEKKGNSVYVFTSGKYDYEKNVFRSKKLNISQGYGLSFPVYFKDSIFKKVDIFHTHQPFLLGLYALYKARKYNKKIVFTNHCQYSTYVENYIPFLGKYLKKIVARYVGWFINTCDKTILPSETFKKQITGEYGAKVDKIEIIPNAISFPSIDQNLSKKLAEKHKVGDKKILIYVGRLGKEKNLTFLINAFHKVTAKNKNVLLFIVGGGPETESLKDLVNRLGEEKNIIFTGYIQNKEVFSYLALSDIFVSASTSEIHPITLLEAMYAGNTAVALASPGFSDTIENGKNGFLINEKSETLFADSITKLITNNLMLKNMQEASKESIKQYELKKVINKTINLYQSL
jgi:glycosyltransferase involved in cell wall biosynthesis